MKEYTLADYLKESLKDPEFKKAWEESEPAYQLSRIVIQKRLAKKMSQKELAEKANTTQAVISRIENMSVNTSVGMLQKIAEALGVKLKIEFE
jgi:ribosome-binding protein aMBF1 (putative translation factor)